MISSLLILTFLSCFVGAWIYTKFISGDISIVFGFISGIINTSLWIAMLKYSGNLIALSAWFDVACAAGYFLGFICFGHPASTIQIFGMILLVIGLFFINC
jgi:hypothetical protein